MDAKTVYVETSVWGSLAPRQPADRKRVVRRLLKLLDGTRAACVISDVVVEEIDQAPTGVADAIRHALASVQARFQPVTEAVITLATAYVAANILPKRRR